MKSFAIKSLFALWLASAAWAGFILILYGEADDSPGAQLLGVILILGAVVLTVRAIWGEATASLKRLG